MNIIDLSLLIDNDTLTCGLPWHQEVELLQMGKLEEVGRNTHRIVLGSHTATHIDAPLHFIAHGNSVDQLNLSLLCGPISIVDLTHIKPGDMVTKQDLQNAEITERMLFRFDWWKNWKTDQYYKNYPYFSEEAGKYLLEKGMRLIALDTPSPDTGDAIQSKKDSPVHKLFLHNNVVIIEYLTNTDKILVNQFYDIIALPLKLSGCDGSPSRVILIERKGVLK